MTKRYYQKSLKFEMLARIENMPGHVVLRKELEDMGGARQLTQCFKDLIKMGKLARIGYGVYAKARPPKYVDIPVIQGGFGQACKEALTKLGVEWETGSAEEAYNAGLSTQVPVRTVVKLKSRCRRKLIYGKNELIFENKTNAR